MGHIPENITEQQLFNMLSGYIENDKYILPFVLPTIERDLLPIQSFYLEQLEQEIERCIRNG